MERRKELANFLQSRRRQLTPEEMGLPVGSRRRTPGLRREEVAQLAAVGQTWYTWLEQGRNIQVSTQVLLGVSRALRLTDTERRHIFDLAKLPVPENLQAPVLCTDPRLMAIVDGFGSLPVMIINQKWDILHSNKLMQELCGCIAGKERPNTLYNLLLDPAMKQRLVNWETQVASSIGLFRSQTAKFVGAEWLNEVVNDLTEKSAEFKKWWPEQAVYKAIDEPKHYRHPHDSIGDMHLATTLLTVQDCPHLMIVVNTPTDDESAENLKKLATHSAA